MVYYYNKVPFSTGRETFTFHSLGQKIGRAVQATAKVVGAAKTAYATAMAIYNLGRTIAPFLL